MPNPNAHLARGLVAAWWIIVRALVELMTGVDRSFALQIRDQSKQQR